MKRTLGSFGRGSAEPGGVTAARVVNHIAAGLAWALLVAIIFVTLAPIKFRPHVGPAAIERFCAYLMLGAAFMVGYPRRLPWVIGIVALAAIGPEAGQLFVRGRHARILDGAEKVLGGMVGVALAALGLALVERLRTGSRASVSPDRSA